MISRDGPWPKHPDKDIQALLVELHEAGWRVEKGKGYYMVKCGCALKHKKTIHLTPSDPYYLNKQRQYFRNHTCLNSKGAD